MFFTSDMTSRVAVKNLDNNAIIWKVLLLSTEYFFSFPSVVHGEKQAREERREFGWVKEGIDTLW